jgi:hypothetical protein
MKPPMHDLITYRKPRIIDGKVQKDSQSFPIIDESTILARVSSGSEVVINDKGQEVRSAYSIAIDPEFEPQMKDEIQVGTQVVTVLKVKPRKSWSGKNIYYWVVECGT